MSLEDVLFVEESVGGGFGDVFGPDVGGGGQVGYGACQLYDAPSGKAQNLTTLLLFLSINKENNKRNTIKILDYVQEEEK